MNPTGKQVYRYAGGLAVVLGVHAAVIIIALNWPGPKPIEMPPAAMVVELPPLPEPPAPPPPPQVAQQQPPAPVEEPPLPKLAEAPTPKIAVPKPVKPKAKPQPKPMEKKPDPPKEVPEQAAKTEPTESEKAAAPKPAPQQPAAPPSNSEAKRTWQSDLLQHLAKYKEYPRMARMRRNEGTVVLEFTLDSDGKLLEVAVAMSSGSSLLDEAAVKQVRKAAPMPKPPAELLSGGTVKLKAPFNFNLTDPR
ncbi:energy transducer TonB family protein [Pseudomonas typographi]|uniref:Protein TonB n=1 Tax=Pseudomonas typographi TaxID=2715964 RepID=A0ABR7YZ18_9PSED|nr:energy transducer TonB [Pseudomonas typographi]MBD1550081.1 TonB family protein [Pseudomonas typographi]MBD1585463.1 TonB family protein [Pseudomonas typographi]MBD1598424.1 TonB family protein [Pseudomonas typographi]